MIVNIIITLVIVVLIALIINGFEDYSNNKDNSISLVLENNIPIIGFDIDGVRKEFLVDTGATYSVINEKDLISIPHTSKVSDTTISGIDNIIKDTNDASIRLSYDEFTAVEVFKSLDIDATINDFNEKNGTNVVGIIGGAFLMKYKCIISYHTNTLTWCKVFK